MTTREQCIQLSEQGLSQTEIAKIVGVSKQRVAHIIGKYCPGHFVKLTKVQNVYPNWRNWMNENRVTRREFVRRMGWKAEPSNTRLLSIWMSGKKYPQKKSIDLILKVTGLTYEQLFYKDGD